MKSFFKKRTSIFFLFNVSLLLILILLTIPLYKFISTISEKNKINKISDNEYVKDSVIINPKAVSPKIINRKVTIKLITKVDESLNWELQSFNKVIEVKIGENNIVNYKGTNLSKKTITGRADFLAQPEKIIPYLIKTECFCFTEQTLKSGESQIFSMVFFLDPSLIEDSNLDDLQNLVFIYKFSEFKS